MACRAAWRHVDENFPQRPNGLGHRCIQRLGRNQQGVPARNLNRRKNAQREREPWLLMASPSLTLSAPQLVTLYARRKQIELSFLDLNSHQYGQAFEDSLTRKDPCIEVLLLLSALAVFATWLVGMACEASGIDQWLNLLRSKRRLCSVMRLGRPGSTVMHASI